MSIIDLKRAIISGVVAVILTIILFFICSLLTAISIIPDGAIRGAVVVISAISALISGFLTSRNVYEYGLLNGIATGIIYFLIMYILSIIFTFSFAFNGLLFKSLLVIIIFSGIGGVVGINSRSQRRKKVRKNTYYKRFR